MHSNEFDQSRLQLFLLFNINKHRLQLIVEVDERNKERNTVNLNCGGRPPNMIKVVSQNSVFNWVRATLTTKPIS